MFIIVKLKYHLIIILCLMVFSHKVIAQETVFVHTDKNDYISGETIRFKAYIVNSGSQQISKTSKVIYFQLTGFEKIELEDIRANIENGICKGQIKLPNSLKTGYYFLSAYSNQMRNYPFEASFNKKILVINQNDKNMDSILDFSITGKMNLENHSIELKTINSAICKINTDKKIYHPSDRIELKIYIESIKNQLGLTNLSVSVAELSPFDDTTTTASIIDYLDITNSLWNQLKYDQKSLSASYIAEKKAYIFSGKVLQKNSNLPLNKVNVLLSTPDSVSNLQYYTTGSDGAFYFQLDQYYDNRTIFLQLKDSNSINKSYYFKIDDKIIHPKTISNSVLNMNFSERTYFENAQKITIINKIYEAKNPYNNSYLADTVKFKFPFYGVPDEVVYPSDYEALNDFSDMAANYLWSVKFKKNANVINLNIVDYENKEVMEKDAFLLINSIPIFNSRVIEPLNTSTIIKVETKKKHVVYGTLNLYGVLSLSLDKKSASTIFSSQQIQSFENKVMVYSKLPANLPNDTNQNKVPDLRQILYWNPEIILDNRHAVIEFTASEYKTKYSIVVQGLAFGNIPVFAKSIIEIK